MTDQPSSAPTSGGEPAALQSAEPLTVRLEIPRHVWAVAALVGVVVLLIAGVVIAQLEDTRTTINDQVAGRLAQVEKTTDALSTKAKPVLGDATRDRKDAKRLTNLTTMLAQQATPLVRNLRASNPGRQLQLVGTLASDLEGHDAGRQLQKAGALADNLLGVDAGRQITASADLARSLLGADVGPTVKDVRDLASTLQTAKLPALSTSITGVTDEFQRQDRLRRLLVRATSVLGAVRATKLVPKLATAATAVPASIVPLLQRVIALLTETQGITRDTRDIVRETNTHAANLDRKLGGDLPIP